MNLLYLDCFSGIAGDMALGALIDAGADESFVRTQLEALLLDGWELDFVDVTRSGVRAKHARVTTGDGTGARDYSEVRRTLASSALDEEVRELATRIFDALARAEARVHGVEIERAHLHEVGAVDAFVDVVGTAAALVSLGPLRIAASPLPVGGGTVDAAHGRLPVPPPAVAELLKGIPIRGGGERELVTPTGAAIVATIVETFGEMPPMTIERIGYGAGTAERDLPNVVRVFVGEAAEPRLERTALLFEANLDDMNPELIPYAIERLLAAGAHDAWTTPIGMKKGRPGLTLSALVPSDEKERVLDVFYSETTTLGVRVREVEKDELDRSWIEVEVGGQAVRVKLGTRGGRVVTASPEYEDAVRVARATGMPLKDVYREATTAVGRLRTRT